MALFEITWETGFWVGLESDLVASTLWVIRQGYIPECGVYVGEEIEPMDRLTDKKEILEPLPF